MSVRHHAGLRAGLAAALLLGLTGLAGSASAQTITFSRVTRLYSPRATEQLSGLQPTDPIGLRDCPCESWRFEGNYAGLTGALNLEYWVGNTMDACRTAVNRQPGLGTTSCWQIPGSVHPSDAIGTGLFNVEIPSRWLVDPVSGACVPPSGRSTSGSLYFSIIARPPDDNSPAGVYTVPYNVEAPIAPSTVTAVAGEQSAMVSWTIGTATDPDSGLSTVPTNIRGFYVLCLPNGTMTTTDAAVCEGSLPVLDGGDADAEAGDATAEASFDAEAGLDAEASVGAEPRLDASMDGSSEASAGDASDAASAMCSVNAFPSDFNPNNEAQFQQYRCSTLIDRTSASYLVTSLTNGTGYRFAVIAQDNAGNRSVLSPVSACVQPQLVTDFWELYEMRAGSGAARPGFCAAPPARGARGGGAGAGALLAVVGLALGLRARSRRGVR